MAYLEQKTSQFGDSIERWEESLNAEFSDLNRDAAIQRFEFTFELLWKTVKIYLEEKEKIECFSPRGCFRESKNIFDLKEEDIELCLKMADDRNLASHVYSEDMANKIYEKMDDYLKISKKIQEKIKEKQDQYK